MDKPTILARLGAFDVSIAKGETGNGRRYTLNSSFDIQGTGLPPFEHVHENLSPQEVLDLLEAVHASNELLLALLTRAPGESSRPANAFILIKK